MKIIRFTLLLTLFLIACSGNQTTTTEVDDVTEPTVAVAPTATNEPAPTISPTEEPVIDMGNGEDMIAVLLPDSTTSDRWEADDRRYFEEIFNEAGVNYVILNAEGEADTQLTQADLVIANGAKVLLMVNLDSTSGATIIEKAHDAGIIVIDYDRLTIEGPGADLHISFDNGAVGRLMGETLEPIINSLDSDPKRIIQLNGAPTDNNATLFRQGYYDVAKPYYDAGDWQLVDDEAVPDWDNDQALIMFEQMLTTASGDVDAVFAANDGLASSVVKVLKSQNFDPLPLSGQDATVDGIQNILSGWQTMTVYKPIKLEVETAAAAAIALLQGEDVTSLTSETINNGQNEVPFIGLTPQVITKDNIAETIIADGFRSWDDICVGEFEEYCPADR